MRKLFFFDIDGTLTSTKEHGLIPDSTKQALKALEDEGHFIALATGRAAFRAKQFLEEIGMDHMICEGGNCIVLNGEEVYYEPLDQDIAKAIYYEALEKGIGVAVSVSDERTRIAPNHRFLEDAGDFHHFMDVVVDEGFDLEVQPPIRRLFLSLKRKDEPKMKSIEQIGIMRYGEDQFVIVEPDDKFKGIRKVCELLHEPVEEVVVFGDGLNDRKMFQDAPFSIAMGNAIPELKEIADYVTTDSDDDGIYNACVHFGWIKE